MLRKRFFAACIDYLVIMGYLSLLLVINLSVQAQFEVGRINPNPWLSQLFSFVAATIPVFLYFFLSERGRHKGTIGKRAMHIQVERVVPDTKDVLIRNLLKFLPWEVAHTGVHWVVYYVRLGIDPPLWVMAVLVLPQVIVIFYMLSIVISKGSSSIYDKVARTKVVPSSI